MSGSGRFQILYVGTLPPRPAGASIVSAQLLGRFARLGHRVRALAPITSEALEAGDPLASQNPDVELTRYTVPYFEGFPDIPTSEDYRRQEGEKIREALSGMLFQDSPDVLVIGSETYALHVPDLARTYSIPSILLVHGGPSTGILNGTYPEPVAREYLRQYAKVDLIVTMAQHWGKALRTLGFQDVRVIPNPVDLEKFAPAPRDPFLQAALGIPDGHFLVLHASNLQPVKRPLDLAKAAARVLRRNSRCVFAVVGDGRGRAEMEQACRAEGVSNSFRFAGWVDHHRMPAYINLADLVVMMSEHETQALVYLETQACGRLLLASDVPGAREVITHGETGLLFRTGDIEDLAVHTLRAASDPGLGAAIGHKARERVREHAIDDIAAAYLDTIDSLVRRHRSPAAGRRAAADLSPSLGGG